jgi:hypothetical protein
MANYKTGRNLKYNKNHTKTNIYTKQNTQAQKKSNVTNNKIVIFITNSATKSNV